MKEKLTSRKFWIALTGIITSIITIITSDDNLIQMISGILLMIADTVVYIYSESTVDKSALIFQGGFTDEKKNEKT